MSCYREAMTLWQEYKEQDVECDRLQRIHTMENLHLLLEENSQGEKGDGEDLGHTLRDDTLMEEVGWVFWVLWSCDMLGGGDPIRRLSSCEWSTARGQVIMSGLLLRL